MERQTNPVLVRCMLHPARLAFGVTSDCSVQCIIVQDQQLMKEVTACGLSMHALQQYVPTWMGWSGLLRVACMKAVPHELRLASCMLTLPCIMRSSLCPTYILLR